MANIIISSWGLMIFGALAAGLIIAVIYLSRQLTILEEAMEDRERRK